MGQTLEVAWLPTVVPEVEDADVLQLPDVAPMPLMSQALQVAWEYLGLDDPVEVRAEWEHAIAERAARSSMAFGLKLVGLVIHPHRRPRWAMATTAGRRVDHRRSAPGERDPTVA